MSVLADDLDRCATVLEVAARHAGDYVRVRGDADVERLLGEACEHARIDYRREDRIRLRSLTYVFETLAEHLMCSECELPDYIDVWASWVPTEELAAVLDAAAFAARTDANIEHMSEDGGYFRRLAS